ncbi:hypothetical protein G7Y89_g15249 [Cudoniella acicularis]|uniref:nitrilase n=1 Tax=Cudoniella acicularis TaxID=354080 RepID=A0A8H4VM88_9HELO|nr:hypothetical protein G7Y89_g15249 [Cudoniella acicularis]
MQVRLGAVQAEPAWNDLQAGIEKTCRLIEDASQLRINVLVFPEVWIPGYPGCIWRESVRESADYLIQYRTNSMRRDSPEMRRIQAAARKAGLCVVLGYSERDGNSIYISQAYIGPSGDMIHHRRKIKPTATERAVWGEGQAESLQVVADTPFGKVGSLNCWEHYQPLLRYAEYSQGVEIHAACWPVLNNHDAGPGRAYHTSGDANLKLCQVIAMEGVCFVVVATQIRPAKGTKVNGGAEVNGVNGVEVEYDRNFPMTTPGTGFSRIYAPDGSEIAEPLLFGKEGIVWGDADLNVRNEVGSLIDVVGHYSRPDLLSLQLAKESATHVKYV